MGEPVPSLSVPPSLSPFGELCAEPLRAGGQMGKGQVQVGQRYNFNFFCFVWFPM